MLDTSLIVAAIDRRDAHHTEAAALLEDPPESLFISQLAIAEVAHFVSKLGIGDEVRFLRNLAEGLAFAVPVAEADWTRVVELVWKYRDLPLGTTDATTIAIAERLGIIRIGTFDQDFAIVRPRHVERFELLP